MPVILTKTALDDMVQHYLAQKAFAFDVETVGDDRLDPLVAPVTWISFSTEGRTDVIPMGHPNGELLWEGPALLKSGERKIAAGKTREDLLESDFSRTKVLKNFGPAPKQLSRAVVFEAVGPLFFNNAITKVGHNIKFDLHAVAKYYGGDYADGPYYDTLVASWILDTSLVGRLSLDDCVARDLGEKLEKGVGKNVNDHSFTDVADYSWRDADATYRLYKKLRERFSRRTVQLTRLLALEHVLMHSVLEMESTGVAIDSARLKEIDAELRSSIDALRSVIFQSVGRAFNMRSNKEKQEVLFGPKKDGGLGLKPLRILPSSEGKPKEELTIYDYAVDKETLDHYADDPLVTIMLMYNAKMKLHSSYVLPYLGGEAIREEGDKPKVIKSKLRNGRVYGKFIQHGTESGRFSSRDPALQTIPARTEDGKKLREIFVADPGCSFVIADYSQIEPRIIASLSGDPAMIATYQAGGDVYQMVADKMSVVRPTGKELVLSMAYGVGAARIASRIGCKESEARDLMDFFNQKFPDIRRHKNLTLQRSRRTKSSVSVLGRERPLPQITWSSSDLSSAAERQAYNHLIQGTAADIMKIAMANVYYELPDEARMLLTVHDEMVVQTPDELVPEVMALVKKEMEGVKLRQIVVPLVADISVGKRWSDK